MNNYEKFIQREIQPLLRPDETIEAMGFLYNKSLLGMVMFGLLSSLGDGYFFAVVTKYQLILIQTEMGFTALKEINKNMLQIPYSQIEVIKVGGFLHQKTIHLKLKTGRKMRFRLNTLANIVPEQKQFINKFQKLYHLNREQSG